MSYVPTSPSISKSVITSSPSPIFTRRLCAPYKSALYVILAALNLILDCPGLKLTIAVYRGFFTRRPLPYVPCVPYIPCIPCVPCVPYVPVWSSNVIQRHFWPVKAWDGPILKVRNARKAPVSPWFITYYFHLYDLACSYFCSC